MDEKDLSRLVQKLLTPTPRHHLNSRDHESEAKEYPKHEGTIVGG